MKQIPPILSLLCLLLSLVVSPAHACSWDSDTLAMESKGLPQLSYIITGRFERNPPLYYEMRLKRVTEEIARNPADLNLYDDAGVACDRLGKGDAAVAWMAKKKAQLDRLDPYEPAVKDHRYRYYANLGTFLVHRWFKEGKDPKRRDEVRAAWEAIAKAVEINPEAHFGREQYQLYAIEWLMNPQKPFFEFLDEKLFPRANHAGTGASYPAEERDKRYWEATRGLLGLIALGNAWESVDIFAAIGYCRGNVYDSSVAALSDLRVRELVNSGTKSQCATGLTGKELIQELRAFPGSRMIYGQNDLEERFTALRANAEKWHANRTAFMETRFAEGKHPDTDSDFWDGYREIPPERVDYGLLREWMVQNPSRALGTIVLTAIIGIGVVSYWLTRFVRSLIEKRQNNVTRL